MAEENFETGVDALLPADRKIGQSRKTNVFGYENVGLAIKVPKQEFKHTKSAEETRTEIENYEQTRKLVASLVAENGGRPEIIEPQTAIIHDAPEKGKVTYSRVQKWYPDSYPLSKMGLGLFDLPRQALVDLKSIFQTNVKMWKERGAFLDIVGSTVSKQSTITKLTRHLFPLFYSENILIDKDNIPRIIDLGSSQSIKTEDFKTKLRCLAQVLGSELSIGMLNIGLIMKKKDSSPLVTKSQTMLG